MDRMMEVIELDWDAHPGDLRVFNQMVMQYQDLVFHQVMSMLRDPVEAEDITQDIFIRAYQNLHQFHGGSFRAWLMRITTNACLDRLRRDQRHPQLSLNAFEEDAGATEYVEWLADDHALPEEVAEVNELRRALRSLLDTLPVEYRVVVELVDVQGFDYSEASQAIGIPLGTVKSRLARARLRLRERFLEDLNAYDNLRISIA